VVGVAVARSPTLISGVLNGTLFPGAPRPLAVQAAERARPGNLKSELAFGALRSISELCRSFIVASFGYQGLAFSGFFDSKNPLKIANHLWLNCS